MDKKKQRTNRRLFGKDEMKITNANWERQKKVYLLFNSATSVYDKETNSQYQEKKGERKFIYLILMDFNAFACWLLERVFFRLATFLLYRRVAFVYHVVVVDCTLKDDELVIYHHCFHKTRTFTIVYPCIYNTYEHYIQTWYWHFWAPGVYVLFQLKINLIAWTTICEKAQINLCLPPSKNAHIELCAGINYANNALQSAWLDDEKFTFDRNARKFFYNAIAIHHHRQDTTFKTRSHK